AEAIFEKPKAALPRRKTAGLKAGFALAAMLGCVAALPHVNQREVTEVSAKVAGNAAVYGTYGIVNVPQDSVLHVIFGIVGGLGGCMTGNAAKFTERLIGRRRKTPEGLEI